MFGFSNSKSFRFGGLGEWKADDTGETEFVIELSGELCKDGRVTEDTIELLGGAGGRRKRRTGRFGRKIRRTRFAGGFSGEFTSLCGLRGEPDCRNGMGSRETISRGEELGGKDIAVVVAVVAKRSDNCK